MRGKKLGYKFLVIVLACLMAASPIAEALAWGGHHHGERYHYRHGKWYKTGWFGLSIAATGLALGAIIASLPSGHKTVVVRGSPYYYYGGYYYKACPEGYVVVPAPALGESLPSASIQIQNVSGAIITVNVPNPNGTFTPVNLVKYKNGYLGPQGEYYPGNPTVEQLRVFYGG